MGIASGLNPYSVFLNRVVSAVRSAAATQGNAQGGITLNQHWANGFLSAAGNDKDPYLIVQYLPFTIRAAEDCLPSADLDAEPIVLNDGLSMNVHNSIVTDLKANSVTLHNRRCRFQGGAYISNLNESGAVHAYAVRIVVLDHAGMYLHVRMALNEHSAPSGDAAILKSALENIYRTF